MSSNLILRHGSLIHNMRSAFKSNWGVPPGKVMATPDGRYRLCPGCANAGQYLIPDNKLAPLFSVGHHLNDCPWDSTFSEADDRRVINRLEYADVHWRERWQPILAQIVHVDGLGLGRVVGVSSYHITVRSLYNDATVEVPRQDAVVANSQLTICACAFSFTLGHVCGDNELHYRELYHPGVNMLVTCHGDGKPFCVCREARPSHYKPAVKPVNDCACCRGYKAVILARARRTGEASPTDRYVPAITGLAAVSRHKPVSCPECSPRGCFVSYTYEMLPVREGLINWEMPAATRFKQMWVT